MKRTRALAIVMAAALSIANAVAATAADEAAAPQFSRDRLEQMVAPIALYPDSLLAQVLMASTYPLEIVEASRWLKANPNLKGDDLNDALKDQDWDDSVKGLCTLPDVVHQMSDNLEWTQDLGDAFLAQQSDVMGAVQVMRNKAYEAGNLKTTEQQTVVVKEEAGTQVVVIQQPRPEVIYVPTYSPSVVYGPTYAVVTPYYPSMWAPYGYGLLAFGAGMAVGAAIWGDCHWGYGYGHGHGGYYGGNNNININVNRYNNYGNRVNHYGGNRVGNNNNWSHNPEHRRGVNYRDSKTASRFGAQGGQSRVTRDQARGYATDRGLPTSRGGSSVSNRAGSAAGNRGGAAVSNRAATGAGNRGGAAVSNRAATGAGNRGGAAVSNRAATGAGSRGGAAVSNRAATGSGNRGSAAASNRAGSASRGSSGGAFQRSGNSSFDRAASSRGASSRGSSSFGRSGGSSRSGGGLSGGGSRGGRR